MGRRDEVVGAACLRRDDPRFDLVPESALPVLAIGLPLIELIAGLGAGGGEAHEAVRTALLRDILLIPVTAWLLPARRRGKETYGPNKKTSDSEDMP